MHLKTRHFVHLNHGNTYPQRGNSEYNSERFGELWRLAMMAELNRLAELVELNSLPSWLGQQIALKREEINQKLETEGYIVLNGPQGEQVTLSLKQRAAA